MLDVAFVRSPVAHGRINAIAKPAGREARVYVAADLTGVKPIRADSGLPGFKSSDAADPRHRQGAPRRRDDGDVRRAHARRSRGPRRRGGGRHRGAARRARHARGAAARRAAGARALEATTSSSRRWSTPTSPTSKARAAIKVTRRIRTARQAMSADGGPRASSRSGTAASTSSTLYCGDQMPHITRTGLSECLGLDQGRIRVISPDVGGGFGYKGMLLPEEVCRRVARACSCGRPVRWLEDRREQLTANANCREHHYDITALRRRGRQAAGHRLRGHGRLRRVLALSVLRLPRGGAGRLDPARPVHDGAVPLPHVVGGDQQAAHPAVPRRGAHRRVLRARTRCWTPWRAQPSASRTRCASPTSCRPRQMPFDNITEQALRLRRLPAGGAPRDRSDRLERPGASARRRASPTAAASASASPSTASRPRTAPRSTTAGASRWCRATSNASARLSPDGVLELRIGAHSHGQGMETTLAQVANTLLGIDPAQRAPHPRRHRAHAVLHRHLGLALHGDVGRRGGHRLRGDRPRA